MKKLGDKDVVLAWSDGTIAIMDMDEYANLQQVRGCEMIDGAMRVTVGYVFKEGMKKCKHPDKSHTDTEGSQKKGQKHLFAQSGDLTKVCM